MPLWNRSSSLASSGGITNRTGGNTEEVYRKASSPSTAQAAEQSSSSPSSSGKGFWSEHAKGIGKFAGVAAPLAAAGIGFLVGGPAGAAAGYKLANTAKNVIGAIGDNVDRDSGFAKFARGLNNKKLGEATDKTYNMFKEDKKDKLNEFGNIVSDYRASKAKPKNKDLSLTINPISTVSNGHVPVGYQASTTPEVKSVIPTGSLGLNAKSALNKFNEKTKSKSKAKAKKKAKSQWKDWRSKQQTKAKANTETKAKSQWSNWKNKNKGKKKK